MRLFKWAELRNGFDRARFQDGLGEYNVALGCDFNVRRVAVDNGNRITGLGDKLEPGTPTNDFRGRAARRAFIGSIADVELREFYVDVDIHDHVLRVGKQQIVWGEADGLKVLDVVNPQSFREFILADFEDSRTADGSHLDRASAKRASEAFWEGFIALPEVRAALDLHEAPR